MEANKICGKNIYPCACQVAGVLTKRTSADWTWFISMVDRGDNLPLALIAEDVA
jgi:hypothetical protein